MARQVLENGVILPAEYSDDWYNDMTSNLTKLDDVIGSDSEKLSSADVGAAALSNSYNDLDNLPTIPTKTSDLTNDSNFVDTSNSAVASGITSAKVTSYDAHIADTNIHVTTADKTKWNNNVTQSYVFRYSSTALVASSTNSNTLLDNTDNLKVGDKVIDSNGVLFSITAIDSVNSTFTIGSALIDLALDANVVYTSGNETINGVKTFTDSQNLTGYTAIRIYSPSDEVGVLPSTTQVREIKFTDKNNAPISYFSFQHRASSAEPFRTCWRQQKVDGTSSYYSVNFNNLGEFYPEINNPIKLGTSTNRWAEVYATNYYYGTNNIEFSTKFVTTDTNQTIPGKKTFVTSTYLYNSDDTGTAPSLYFKSSKAIKGDSSGSNNDSTRISHIDKNDKVLSYIQLRKVSNGSSDITFYCSTTDTNNQDISSSITFFKAVNGQGTFRSVVDNDVNLGNASYKWKDVNTYLVNGLTPSALGMPSDRSARIDISGYFTNTGTGNTNDYSVPDNGFIFLNLLNAFAVICYSIDGTNNINYAQSYLRPVDGQIYILFPVRKNDNFRTLWTANGGTITVTNAYFIPCQGNV